MIWIIIGIVWFVGAFAGCIASGWIAERNGVDGDPFYALSLAWPVTLPLCLVWAALWGAGRLGERIAIRAKARSAAQ